MFTVFGPPEQATVTGPLVPHQTCSMASNSDHILSPSFFTVGA
jgi:hypothetical protein